MRFDDPRSTGRRLRGLRPKGRYGPRGWRQDEPRFETYEQKLEWRDRLRTARNRRKKLSRDMEIARRSGLVQPAKWSEAQRAEYRAGPWEHALEEQRAVDEDRERRRAEEILWLEHDIDVIGVCFRTQMIGTPDEVIDAIEFATRARRMRLSELRSDDWRLRL